MIFTKTNTGEPVPLIHISSISKQGNQIIYEKAKGGTIVETFEDESELNKRYEELKDDLLV